MLAPTSDVPNCGILVLKNGADGRVTLSVGSCDGLVKVDDLRDCREVGDTEALVVTAIASLKDSDGDSLYSRKHPAKVILSCDKALLSQDEGCDQVQGDLHPEQHRSAEEGRATVPEEGCTLAKAKRPASITSRATGAMATSTCPFLFNVDGRFSS